MILNDRWITVSRYNNMFIRNTNNSVIEYYATKDLNAQSIFLAKIINYFSKRQHDFKQF